MTKILDNLSLNFEKDINLSKYTSWKVGGNAEYFIEVSSIEEFQEVLSYSENTKTPLTIIGGGNNILVSDKGIKGIVLRIYDKFSNIEFNDDIVTAQTGLRVSKFVRQTVENGLTGLEGLCGIPGTVGGMVYMNAGSLGVETKDFLVNVKSMDKKGNIITRTKDEINFSYRYSDFQKLDEIILSASFKLPKGDVQKGKELISEFNKIRKSKQNIKYPSCGSVFKNPEGTFAGKLIEDVGFKGLKIGDAQVSESHANFIVNLGNAKAQDIYNLIHKVKEEVYNKFEISLKTEVRLLGEFDYL